MDDDHLGNGDQSGSRNFVAVSPSVGIMYKGVFANISTAFETPTTTELINRPDGLGASIHHYDRNRQSGLKSVNEVSAKHFPTI